MDNTPQLSVLGLFMQDFIYGVSRLPQLGETIHSQYFTQSYGGKGSNQALTARAFGVDVSFIGKIGDDMIGNHMREYYQSKGIQVNGLQQISEKTGNASIYLTSEGDNSIVINLGAGGQLTPNDVIHTPTIQANISNAKLLLTQLELPFDTIFAALELAKQSNTETFLDPSPVSKGALPDSLYPLIDYIKPNEVEVANLTGIKPDSEKNTLKAADFFLQKGVKHVLISRGEKPLVYKSNKIHFSYLPPTVQTIDTIGAGDIFSGALCAALLKQYSIKKAVAFAVIASALSTEKNGAASSIPKLQEVYNTLENYEKKNNIN